MLAASGAVLLQFHASWVIAAVFLGGVVALFAFRAGQGDYGADIFLFGCHFRVAWLPLSSQPRFLHLLLFDNLRNLASTHGQAAFADGEFGTLLKSNLAD